MTEKATTAACAMLRELMPLSPDDQIEALALVVRGWCGLRGHPWSDGECWPPVADVLRASGAGAA